MTLSKDAKGRLAYGWLWCWLGIVVGTTAWCYVQLVDFIGAAVVGLPALSAALDATGDTVFSTVLKFLGGVLCCWRVVKVVVLHGSPIPWGLQLSSGRENGGVSGRQVYMASIESGGKTLFGVVMRAHPASDKLVRTRLEFLVFALPLGRGLMVSESRIHWLDRSKGEKLYGYFINRVARYSKPSESKSPDRFRQDVVRHLDEIAKTHRTGGKRIDGLTWLPTSPETWHVSDDFGYALTCARPDGNNYEVEGIGADGNGTTTVKSIRELRDVAKQELNPVYT